MEKVTSGLELVDLSKRNFRKTLESLQEGIHSVLLLTVQWKEIESYFDSTRNILEERAKELDVLEESIKVRALELETKEKELCLKQSDLEKKEKEFELEQKAEVEKKKGEVEQLEKFTTRIESVERFSDEKLMELDVRAKELELKVREVEKQREQSIAGDKLRGEFEPLVSLLAKNMGSSVTMPTKCSSLYLNDNAIDFANDLVKKNTALATMVPYLDPAKFVLDAIEGSFKEYLNKDLGEADDRVDSVVNSCIILLETLIKMNPKMTKVKEEATQLGIDWIGKAKTNQNNNSLVLGCLFFLAAYNLASLTTLEVLLTLLERFLLYDQAPKLFRLLGLENKVSGAVETLKKKEEYLATLKFICEFRLYKLCPKGRPGELLLDFLISSDKAARVIAGTGNSMEAQKARREKRRADAVMALKYIKEAKAESMFPAKILKKLTVLKNDESVQRAMEPVHKSYEKRQSTTKAGGESEAKSIIPYEQKNEAKRQRLTEPIAPSLDSTVKRLEGVSVPSGDQIKESGVNHQPGTIATHSSSTETKPSNISSGFINADMLRELVKKQPPEESEDLSNALKCTPDPAKLVLDTSMALCPTNAEGGYEFKLLVTSASCFLLLNQLKKVLPQIGHPVKGDAKKLAVYWKDKILKSKRDDLEVICFLRFLGIFGIVLEFKANDLLGLLDNSYWQTVSPDLCQFLGLDNAIPGFIQNLIKIGHRIKAIDYIYSFGMVHKFQPVSAIIYDSLRITKESAEKSYGDAKNQSATQVAAIDRQIRSLRAAIKCISCHKLESEFQLGNLEEQIKSLLKLRRFTTNGSVSGSASKPDSTIQQSQTEIPPNVAEVASVTSNTRLEPSREAASSSASKPSSTKKNKRGKKRSLSGNNQNSGHFTSHTSNHIPSHDYSMNQRQHWPVDSYDRGFTEIPNSDYNYNQWRQPEGPQVYQVYHQPFNPFYRKF